jgi:hypothetical protein
MIRDVNGYPQYTNLLLPFNTLVAVSFFIFGLDPVSQWAVMVVVFGLLICLALYILMRKSGIGIIPASIAIMFVPFLAQSGNLPGVWFLLPYNVGLLALIFMLVGLIIKNRPLTIVAGILSVIFYPPMMVFVVPTLIVALIMRSKNDSSMKLNNNSSPQSNQP